MSNFIAKVVSSILTSNRKIEDQIIVLPSKRAGVFLKNEILKQIEVNSWSPKILTIEDLILDISSLNIIGNIQLLFEYYEIYLSHNKNSEKDSFDKFTKWANIALYDFNEIDRYLIDPQLVFKNLQDIKRLESWDLEQTTDLMNKFMSFWINLEAHYYELNKSLEEKNIAYQGMAFRVAAEKIQNYINEELEEEKFFHFVGFNAINNAEETIITKLLDSNKAEIYWDSDTYYQDNQVQEAGIFLRRHKKKWKYFNTHKFTWIENNFGPDKEINIIGVPKSVGQAKIAGKILADLNNEYSSNLTNSALVLADENLLLPSLNSLPESIKKVNITMGYPIKNSPLAGLFELIFILHEKVVRLNRSIMERPFYSKDLIKLLKHPSLVYSLNLDGINSDEIIDKLVKENLVFIGVGDLKPYLKSNLLKLLLMDWNDDSNLAIKNSLELVSILKIQFTKDYKNFSIELEYLFRFAQIFNQLLRLQEKYSYLANLKTLLSFYKQLLSSESLSFKGEPLEGLQLMGMLETRVLDFENVVLTSVNEGILPSGNSDNSFIPYDLKIELGLPTYTEKDAIYSYHFYRLIQGAKKVYLLYNTETDEFGSGEKSRFITQLIHESKAKINEFVFSAKPDVKLHKAISIIKNKNVLARLDELAISGFSPSSLSNYMRNPLDFYYQRILRLRETEEIEETADHRTLGDIVHHVLEILYTPFVNKVLTLDSIKLMKSKILEQSKKSFEIKYKNGDIHHGKNHLIFKVVEELVRNYLRHEEALVSSGKSVKIIGLEKSLETKIILPNSGKEIIIKGFIDRIDQVDETIRILDYKTGNVKTTDLNIKDFGSITEDQGKPKALQLLIYSLMFRDNSEFSAFKKYPLVAGIIPLKNSKESIYEIKQGRTVLMINDDILDSTKELVSELLEEIYNSELKFEERETSNT